jgi:LAS seventeen-binding protein 5
MIMKELPRRKQQVTQEKSRVLRETERDPFEDAADEEEEEEEPQPSSSVAQPKPQMRTSPQASTIKSSSTGFFSSLSDPASSKKSKKDKKGNKKKSKAFNLEEEKPKMRTVIAESSVASTNLLNALQFINREQEQVSENAAAVRQFETCKMLRRHVLRYVSTCHNSRL